jgi:leucyl/phenylalanyl-tRNA--protein transferase
MLYALDPSRPDAPFPDVEAAETEPDGLLAMGGDLSVTRLLNAYRHGIFPWYGEGQPILWWSPNPRTVLFPNHLKISRSLRKTLRKQAYMATLDRAFGAVIQACAEPRPDGNGTWIVPELMHAYAGLHRAGHAHSVEIWREDTLAGGLYGVALGRVFYGESMFSRASDTSKIALVHLVNVLSDWGYQMIDCQIYSPHLESLGAIQIPRSSFVEALRHWCPVPGRTGSWETLDPSYPETPDGAM